MLFNPIYFLVKNGFKVAAYLIPYRYNRAVNPTLSLDTIRNYNKNRTLGPRKIICNAPFTQIYFKQDGKLTACCASSVDAYGNINDGTINQIWNGIKADKLRRRILNYDLSGGCLGCQHSLEVGNYNAFIGRVYDTIFPVKVRDYPNEMTFEISNTCNLECIMCSGEFSNLIRKKRENMPPLPNHYDNDFFEQVKDFLPKLKRVRFMGGEPFLIKEYKSIINYILENNKDCKIHIQTNGTILNENVKRIVESENVELSISIDSLQKNKFEEIRKNSNYERVMENLSYFSYRAQKYHQLININFCVMNNNWNEVADIVLFCEKRNFSLAIIPVVDPAYLSLSDLKYDELNNIYEYSKQSLKKIKNVRLNSIYIDYLNYLKSLLDNSIAYWKNIEALELQSEEILYKKAKELFVFVNNIPEQSDKADIFDITLSEYKVLDRIVLKELLCHFIIQLKEVDAQAIKTNFLNYDELLKESKHYLDNLYKIKIYNKSK